MKTNVPEWLIVKVKEGIPQVLETSETGGKGNSKVKLSVSLPQYSVRPRTQQQRQFAKTDSEHVEISKLRVFIQTFNSLSGCEWEDVNEYDLTRELTKPGEFDDEQLMEDYIMKAVEIDIISRKSFNHIILVGPNKWTSLKRARRESNPRQPDFFQ